MPSTSPAVAVSVKLPPSVVLASGQTSVVFNLTVVDDNALDGAQFVTLTATVTNWTPGVTNLAVADNDTLQLDVLLDIAEGKGTKVLSAAGSLEAIISESAALINGIRNGQPDKLGKDKVADSVSSLNNIRPRLDKRTHAYADALLDFGRAFRQYTTGDQPDSRPEVEKALGDLRAKGSRVNAEWDKLRSDQLLMETVMQQ